MARYDYYVELADFEQVDKFLLSLNKLLVGSKELSNFIAKKCESELNRLCQEKLNNFNGEEDIKGDYVSAMHTEIKPDYIYLYNDSEIDIASKNLQNPSNYEAKLSLAEIVEYGIGYTGQLRTELPEEGSDWVYDVNNHGYKGWYYKDEQGNIHWTNGYEGKLIFYNLKLVVMDNIQDWIVEYLDKYIKKGR